MKKKLFLLGMTVAVLTSCSKNEVLDVSDNAQSKAIGFNTYVGNTTRAVAKDNTIETLKGEGKGFYVHGKYQIAGGSEVEVFKGDEQAHVTWSGSVWQYSPENYWIPNATYRFAAFAPKLAEDVGHTFDYTNLTITDFFADGKTDLIVAASGDITANEHIGATKVPVNFTFKHALSKVKFTFKHGWNSENIKMTITDISLTNVETKGTLTTPDNLSEGNITNDNWALASAPSEEATYQDATDITLPNGDVITYEYEHFFIPQALTPKNITLTFTISVKNGEDPLNIFQETEGSIYTNTKTIMAKLPTESVKTWTPGYAYNYNIEITGNALGMAPIKFDVERVEGWNTTEDIDFPISAN